jgi:hypothetical protein
MVTGMWVWIYQRHRLGAFGEAGTDLQPSGVWTLQVDTSAPSKRQRRTVAMWVLFQVLLSTMTVRLAIAVVWYP